MPFVSVKHGSAYISNVECAMFNIDSEPCLQREEKVSASLPFLGVNGFFKMDVEADPVEVQRRTVSHFQGLE